MIFPFLVRDIYYYTCLCKLGFGETPILTPVRRGKNYLLTGGIRELNELLIKLKDESGAPSEKRRSVTQRTFEFSHRQPQQHG